MRAHHGNERRLRRGELDIGDDEGAGQRCRAGCSGWGKREWARRHYEGGVSSGLGGAVWREIVGAVAATRVVVKQDEWVAALGDVAAALASTRRGEGELGCAVGETRSARGGPGRVARWLGRGGARWARGNGVACAERKCGGWAAEVIGLGLRWAGGGGKGMVGPQVQLGGPTREKGGGLVFFYFFSFFLLLLSVGGMLRSRRS